ncbi:MAG: DUF2959 domain-containing protein [Verrucomicrobia bacterium]|nr:DUF2959 domain-containing protein [Verrucomicrobiota bacterium]
MTIRILALAVPLLLLCAGTGCRSTYYSAMEKVGIYKRDLLKKRVVAARDDQKEASQQFKSAMTRMKELYGFQGGNLEKVYDALKRDYDRSVSKSEDVHKRIRDVETVSQDLFKEWEEEIQQISAENLRANSRNQLQETRSRYNEMHLALKRAEKSMEPVLTALRDHVLYLKHNLNAQAIASLKGEAASIQSDIAKLIADMNAAIARADEFIKQMQ